MPSKTCRTCGEQMSAASGNLDCHRCRYKARPAKTRSCRVCGNEFTSKATGQICRTCSQHKRRKPCPECGEPMDYRAKNTCMKCREVTPAFLVAAVDPTTKMKPVSLRERVAELLRTAEPWGDCLLAQRSTKANKGYVRIKADGEFMLAHRAVVARWMTLPDDMTVDHLCHNADFECDGGPTCPHRRCVNPEHLGIVTAVQNWDAANTWMRRQRRQR